MTHIGSGFRAAAADESNVGAESSTSGGVDDFESDRALHV
jgi:hypothetical protein